MGNGRLLIVDDDPAIHEIVQSIGPELGLAVDHAHQGRAGLERCEAQKFDVVLLDLGLPDLGGMAVLKSLRATQPDLPILLLTSRSAELDKVLGLETGADDYLTKPFSVHELIARVRSVLRRKQAYQHGATAGKAAEAEMLVVGEMQIDPRRRMVTRSGTELDLSSLEFDIVWYLAKNHGRVVSRDELLEHVWGYSPGGATNYDGTVSTNMSRLRAKIEPNPEQPRYILTVRGVGYRFIGIDSASSEQAPS